MLTAEEDLRAVEALLRADLFAQACFYAQRSGGKAVIPSETLLALKVSPGQIGEQWRMAAAAKFFELGRLVWRGAARLAGVPRTVFLARLTDYGVDTFRLTEADLWRETRLG